MRDGELRKYATESTDPKIQAMWKLVEKTKASAARWCSAADEMRRENEAWRAWGEQVKAEWDSADDGVTLVVGLRDLIREMPEVE